MRITDLDESIGEFKAEWQAAVDRTLLACGPYLPDASEIERLARRGGPIGETLRRSGEALIAEFDAMPRAVPPRIPGRRRIGR